LLRSTSGTSGPKYIPVGSRGLVIAYPRPFRTRAWLDIGYGERESSVGAGVGIRSAIRRAERATAHNMWGGCRLCPGRERRDGDSAMVGYAGVAARIVCDLREGALDTPPGRGVFSASLGEFVLAAILCFAKDREALLQMRIDAGTAQTLENLAAYLVEAERKTK
jgi:hypothetical protein